jgi:hypothetical protein
MYVVERQTIVSVKKVNSQEDIFGIHEVEGCSKERDENK